MSHSRQVWTGGAALFLAACGIWSRDIRWMNITADTLPLALGLPLALLLGRPWHIKATPISGWTRAILVSGAMSFLTGWIMASLTLLTFGWAGIAIAWANWGFSTHLGRSRLLWIIVLSFPWLVIDWPSVGWNFRISAATVAEHFFRLLELPIHRSGTSINIMGVPVEIEAACSGWNLLQLTLLAGATLGIYEIRSDKKFHILLCCLPVVAWFANLLRILILTAIALSYGTQVAGGSIHGLIGLLILLSVILMTKGICVLIDPRPVIEIRTRTA